MYSSNRVLFIVVVESWLLVPCSAADAKHWKCANTVAAETKKRDGAGAKGIDLGRGLPLPMGPGLLPRKIFENRCKCVQFGAFCLKIHILNDFQPMT